MSHKTGGLIQTPEEELLEIKVNLDNAHANPDGWSDLQIAYRRGFLEGRAVEITREMDSHPEWWGEYACECHDCATY